MNLQSRPREDPEINLTSLIDVVLLLIIFFMVSTSFVRESEISIQLPSAEEAAETEAADATLDITITATGSYFVNGRALVNNRPDTLRRALEQELGEQRDKPVTISADAQTTHQSVVTAMDVLGALGVARIHVATVDDPGTD
ncbi:MAG: biopolymer transporter ExbD [Gammaproteobacteria bacterium]|nr:biopolymer transporter ExbD [Gammaproteobacteria bacterium]